MDQNQRHFFFFFSEAYRTFFPFFFSYIWMNFYFALAIFERLLVPCFQSKVLLPVLPLFCFVLYISLDAGTFKCKCTPVPHYRIPCATAESSTSEKKYITRTRTEQN